MYAVFLLTPERCSNPLRCQVSAAVEETSVVALTSATTLDGQNQLYPLAVGFASHRHPEARRPQQELRPRAPQQPLFDVYGRERDRHGGQDERRYKREERTKVVDRQPEK